jgi:hypothetical protein
MAKAKFSKLDEQSVKTETHADLQKKKKIGRPPGTKKVTEQANDPLTVAFTKTQKQELIQYAASDDRSAGYIIKKLLIENGIISKQ